MKSSGITDFILETVELSEDNNWTHVFSNLPEGYHNANREWIPYVYEVSEEPVPKYTAEILETPITIQVQRDMNNILALNLKFIKVSLRAMIEKSDGTTLDITEEMRALPELSEYLSILKEENGKYVYTLDKSNNFSAIWHGFPWQIPQSIIEKDHLILDHYPIDYILEIEEAENEDGSKNPYAAISGTMSNSAIIVNNPPDTTSIQVTKYWDTGDPRIAHPKSVTVHLHANGEEVRSATLTADQDWEYIFEGLPIMDSNKKEIEYTITEDQIEDYYLTEIRGEGTENIELINAYRTESVNYFRFIFTKQWRGDVQEIDFTLYNPDGSVRHHGFTRKKISDTEYLYEAWLSNAGDYYVIEEPLAGYSTTYLNAASHADEHDRVYNGGVIINSAVPKTGDSRRTVFWMCLAVLSLMGIAGYTLRIRKKHTGR